MVWFLVAALLTTVGLLPAPVAHFAVNAGKFLITVALTGVGLSADFRKMAKTGMKPLFLGFLLWVTVALMSLGVKALTGRLG